MPWGKRSTCTIFSAHGFSPVLLVVREDTVSLL